MRELKAKEWALECSVVVLFIVALAGIVAGAEPYVAVLRGAAAAVVVAFGGRFPARVVIEAMAPVERAEEGSAAAAPGEGTEDKRRAA